jgi:hypothetical protein
LFIANAGWFFAASLKRPVAIVLDLVNPVGAGRGLVGNMLRI